MLKYLTLLLSLFLPLSAFAECQSCKVDERLAMNVGVVGGGVAAACSATTGACTSATAGECGTTFLLCEDYDGAAGCKNGSAPSNCQVQYTLQQYYQWGTFNETATKIEGTNSYLLSTSDNCVYSPAFTSTSPLYFFMKVKVAWTTNGTNSLIISFGGYPYIHLAFNGDGTAYAFYIRETAEAAQTGHNYSYGTTYNVWLEYTKGTGANGKIYLFVSSTSTKGSAVLSIENSDLQNGLTGVTYGPCNVLSAIVTMDHIRVSATQMTGVPD